jgi:hypothetical protein
MGQEGLPLSIAIIIGACIVTVGLVAGLLLLGIMGGGI